MVDYRACVLASATLLGGCQFDDSGVALTQVTIEPTGDPSIGIEERRELYLVLHYDDGFTEHAPDDQVMWLVDDGTILEVQRAGQIKGRGIGTAVVTAEFRAKTATAQFDVFDVPRQLEIRVDRNDVATGLARQFTAEVRYEHGVRADATDQVMWSTTSDALATIDATGLATGVAPGRVDVLATGFDLQARKDLHIRPAVAITVDLTPLTATVAVGDRLQLEANALYSDGNAADITTVANWTSSLPDVAHVNQGLVEGRAPGEITVSAGRDDVFSVATITVVPAQVPLPETAP